MPFPRRISRLTACDERGQVLVMFVGLLFGLLVMAAFVLDVAHMFQVRRHLQVSADAAALAAARELPVTGTATTIANQYSGSSGGRNHNANLPVVVTGVTFPAPTGSKVKVTQSATANSFFGGILGFDGYDISASATASRMSQTAGTPMSVFVHEVCGASTGNKGLIAAGKNMRIEGSIHVNGQFTVGDSGFNAVGRATVYRPSAGSPAGPAQGTCNGTAPLRIQDQSDSRYCTGCSTGAVTDPAVGPWRDWVTPYHTEAIMKSYTPCTINHTNDVKYENTTIPTGVHCLPADRKFTIAGNTSGTITVIGGIIEVGGTGTLRPFDNTHPVLFYSTNGASTTSGGTAIKLNPSSAYDWTGYIINRFGGIEINAGGVTSPQNGLLEAKWVHINGENFRMLGTFPDTSGGTIYGAVRLDD